MLAILSLQNQQIHLLQVRDDGTLLDLMTIGTTVVYSRTSHTCKDRFVTRMTRCFST